MDQANEYEIVIIECCENCDYHQAVTKHSEWKYYQHFNELKKKIERYVAGAIVIKNPIPDELHQPQQLKLEKNVYFNKQTQQKIIFPRIGSFQVYIYNILISSKLTTSSWPNHYKILQTINQIITAKKQGLSIEEFSIYQGEGSKEETSLERKEKKNQNATIKQSPENKETQQRRKIVSKKKKAISGNEPSGPNRFRVYKSKEPKLVNLDKSLNKTSAILDPLTHDVSKKLQTMAPLQQTQLITLKNASLRDIESKNQNRVKLPSLKNTLNMLNASQNNRKSFIGDISIDQKRNKPIFNTIDGNVFDKDEMSIIQKDPQMIRMLESEDKNLGSMNRFDSLELYNNQDSILVMRQKAYQSPSPNHRQTQHRKQSMLSRHQQRRDVTSQNDFNNQNEENDQLIDEQDDMRIVENRSIQYEEIKEYMTRSIQYEQNVEFCEDFGVQIDQMSRPKDIMMQFVQTDHVEFKQPETEEERKKRQKPYMLDESVQAHIIIKKKEKTREVQTFVPQLKSTEINTDLKEFVNRANQFPDQDEKNRFPIQLENKYIHLFEKRRNLPIEENQNVYSVDRFEEKTTKYKWIGKAFEDLQFKQLKKKMLLEALVFAVYNFFGIKTPQKRIAFLQCSNVIGEKITSNNTALYHLLSEENPEIQYFSQFEQLDVSQKIFPLSEEITYRNSKQKIKFNNWGNFLALVYFLDDNGVFDNAAGRKSYRENLLASPSSSPMNQSMSSPREFVAGHLKHASSIGLVITNEEVKEIYRMSSQNYQLFPTYSPLPSSNISPSILSPSSLIPSPINKQQLIFLTSSRKQLFIDPTRLSKSVQLQFISMLSRLTMEKTFTELKHYLNDIFINQSKVYDEKFLKLFEGIQKYDLLEQQNQIKQGKTNLSRKDVNARTPRRQLRDKIIEASELDEMQELLKAFIDKLQTRFTLISHFYKGKIHCYRKYNSLQAKISYSLPSTPMIPRSLQVTYIANVQKPQSQQRIQIEDVIKMLKNNTNMYFLTGEEGLGKSFFLNQVRKTLSDNEKYNVMYLQRIQKVEEPKKFIDSKFYQKKKNIILVDNLNSQKDAKLLVRLIKTISQQKQDKYNISYLCILKHSQTFDSLTLKLNSLINRNISRQQKFINLKLLSLSQQNIKYYISKTVDFKNVTQKNQLSNKIIEGIERTPALRNPLYLNLFCQVIETERLDEFIQEFDPNKVTKWMIMKRTFEKCKLRHQTQLKDMDIELPLSKDVYFQLRQLVMRLHVIDRSPQSYSPYKKSPQDSKHLPNQQAFLKLQQHKVQLIQQLFTKFQQDHDRLIKNHLQFFPVDTKYLVKIKTQKAHLMQDENEDNQEINSRLQERNNFQAGGVKLDEFFVHAEFYCFLLVEAFSYYLAKGFKNLQISDVVLEPHLIDLLRQKAQMQPSFCQHLLQLVYDTQMYPSLSQQGSNAMSLLCQLNYQFSNLIFDHCQLLYADLSLTTFYNCSFRDTNLHNSTIYKTAFMNCAIDATIMDNVNLLVRKYEIEWTPLCCALSRDNRQIVLGCGNFLVVLATDTGKEIKKVQAHLDVIRSVKFSKDGQYLITIADDKTLRTWDKQNFKSVVFKLPQKGGAIFFSNQSQTIATIVNKNDLKVWNIKSMANQGLFEGHTDQITSVNFSLNGEYILTGSKDTTVRLWNLKGKQLHIYKGNDKEIICCKISPTNAIVASSSKEKQLVIFQTLTESIVAKKEFQNEIIQICLDLREIYICCAFAQDEKISILSFNTLEIIHKLQGHQQKIISINFDATFEKLISLSKDRTVRLWDLQSIMQKQLPLQELNQAQKTFQGPVLSIVYCKKSSRYATGHQNGQINIWEDQANKIIYKLTDHHGFVSRLQFDLTGKLYSGGKDGILRIWNFDKMDSKKKQPYKKLQLFSVQMVDMKINDRNKIIVMSSANNEFVVYDFTGIKMIMSTRDEGKVNAIAFDQKDKYMAIGGNEKYIVTFKLENQGNTITRSEQLGEHPQVISCLAYQGESLLISVLKNGHIYIWNHMRVALIKKIENMSPITCLSIYNKIFGCLSSEDGKIRIINLDEGREVKVFKYKEPCLQFVTKFSAVSGDSSSIPLMYAACKDGNIIKWNLNDLKKANQKSFSLLPMIANQKKVSKFGRKTVNQDGTVMAEVEGEKTIQLKNLHEHTQEIISLPKCPSPIEGIEFIEPSSHQKTTHIHQKLLILLKSGQFWSLKSNSLYEPSTNDPSSNNFMLNPGNLEGDLFYSKIKEQLFYKSGIKKVSKQIRKPTQMIVDEVTIGG